MSEIKSATFRLTKSATEQFKEYCEENHLTAAQGFDYLMEVLALDNARASLTARETEISNFEQHAKALISAYLHSLELNMNAEARIREEFATQMESQIRTISDYQQQIGELEEQLEEATSLAHSFQEDYTSLLSELEEIRKKRNHAETELTAVKADKEKQLGDKNSIINMLSAKLAEAESKATNYDALLERSEALQRDLTAAEQNIRDNAKDAEMALERAVRAAEKALEAEHRKELDRLRSQNTELLQTIATTEKTASDEIRAIEKENASLRETLASLRKAQEVNE